MRKQIILFATALTWLVSSQSHALDVTTPRSMDTKFQATQGSMNLRNMTEESNGVPETHRSLLAPSTGAACKTILIFHGLYESPGYLKGLTKYFTGRGFDVVSLLLSGHFRQNDPTMKRFTYKDWRQDAEDGLKIAKQLGHPVFVLGYSTGGTMAADLALRFPKDISGLFFFAPALKLTATTQTLSQIGSTFGIMPVELCNKADLSPMCKAIAHFAAGGVKNARPLLAEDLSWSPHAGVQVNNYINAIFRERSSMVSHESENPALDGEADASGIEILSRIYGQMSQPTFMVLDDGDLTVSTNFSKDVFSKLQNTKDLIVYKQGDNISHTNITKYPEDAYKGSKDYYNHFTNELEQRMDTFLSKVAPACE